MTIKAEAENLSVFATVKNVYFFMDAKASSMVNSFFQLLDSISLSRATCKHDFGYFIMLMATYVNKQGQVLDLLQEKQTQTCNLCFWNCLKGEQNTKQLQFPVRHYNELVQQIEPVHRQFPERLSGNVYFYANNELSRTMPN